MTNKHTDALDRAYELLDRIDIQCRHVGHPVGGIDELKHILRTALSPVDVEKLYRPVILENGWYSEKNEGWNDCISHLRQRGMLKGGSE